MAQRGDPETEAEAAHAAQASGAPARDPFAAELLERISDAFVAFDRDWRYTYVNRHAAEMTGRGPADLLGKHVWTEFPEGVGQPFQRAYERAMAEQKPVVIEDHYAPWDRWFENRIYPSPEGLAIFIREVTEQKRMERALQDSEARFRALVEQAPDGIVVVDPQGRHLDVNARVCAMFGYSRDEMLRLSSIDLIDPEDRARLLAARIQIQEGAAYLERWQARRKDGSTLAVEAHGRRAPDGNVIAIVRDISDRLRAESAIRERDERFRALVEHSADGIFVSDAQGHYLDVNSSGCSMLGYSREELLRLRIDDVVVAEERPRVAPELADVAAGDRHLKEWLFRRKDGSTSPGEVHAKIFPDGTVVAIVRDITERKRLEQALRDREHFLSEVLDAEPGTVYLYDLVERRNVYINRHWLTAYGYSPEETQAMGSALAERVFHPDDLARIAAHHEAFRGAAERELRTIEYRIRTKAGEWRWLLSREVPFTRDAVGDVRQILGITHDVTEARRAEQQLRENATQLRELSARVLAAQEDERRRVARELHDELGQTLTALKLRIEAGDRVPSATTIDADTEKLQMVDDAIGQVRRLAQALRPTMLDDLGLVPALRWLADQAMEQGRFSVHFGADIGGARLAPEVETACFRIAQQALTNVVQHARATRIAVELRRTDAWLVLSVRDDGAGFDTEAQRARAGESLGFGLRGMVERAQLADGQLELESSPGFGTLVRAQLPWRARA